MSEDEWYAALDQKYSQSGYTREEFVRLTLESATQNDEGICWPPCSNDWHARFSLLMRMWLDGLIVRKNFGYHTPILPYLITDKGREYIEKKARRA